MNRNENKKAAMSVIAGVASLYEKKLDTFQLSSYVDSLWVYSPERLGEVGKYLVEHHKFWPTIAEWHNALRAGAGKGDEPTALPPPEEPTIKVTGLARYIAMAAGKRGDWGVVPGDSHQDRMVVAIQKARDEKATPQVIAILEGALIHGGQLK